MKKILYALALIILSCLHYSAFTQKLPSTTSDSPLIKDSIFPEGKYQLQIKKDKNKNNQQPPSGNIDLIKLDDSIYKIKLRYISAVPGKNLGIINDYLIIKNNKAVYQSNEDSTCRIEFFFSNNSVTIVQHSESSAFACGFGRNVHIDGMYLKVKEKFTATPPPSIRLGKHGITLQWIGWEKQGTATITEAKNGFYQIIGKQLSENGHDYLEIVGILLPVSQTELNFEGIIKTSVSYINQGKICERKGKFTFIAKPGKKYWRLKESQNCEAGMVTDYIDIYF
jgi:hypothetical protein